MDTADIRRELGTSVRLLAGPERWLLVGLVAGSLGYLVWLAGTGVAVWRAAEAVAGEPTGDDGNSRPGTESGGAGGAATATASATEETEFTGTVVQTGDPVVLDDGQQTKSVETDASLRLGEEVTVRGAERDGTIHADDVF
mgnify:CR=1 FL=1